MSKTLDEATRIRKSILSHLNKVETMKWTPLYKQVLKDSGTPAKFNNMLRWLFKHGYVAKKNRGIYYITEKGKKQLAVWSEDEKDEY